MVDKKFRTAINGYNKDDVYKYIDKIAVDTEQTLREKEEYMKKMEQELAKLRDDHVQEKEACEQLHRETADLREKLEQETQQKQELQQKWEQLTAEIEEKPDENQLTAQWQEENQKLTERIRMLEAERDKIPAALIVAQRQADEIVRMSQEKMHQYEMEMQDKIEARYHAAMDKMKQVQTQIGGSESLLEEMENGVRLAMAKFVQATGQAKRETAELAKMLEAAQMEESAKQ